jgi:MerR family transcriptional regulator, light-induced transcriptional regulator
VNPTERSFSPRELADAIGVSESSVKRWVDAGELVAARTAGGHRRIALPEAVRFIRARQMSVVEPAILGLADIAHVPASLAAAPVTADLLVDVLTGVHAEQARALVVSAYLRGEPLAPLCDGPVREAMHGVGEAWKQGRRGIAVEHSAVDLFVQAFSQIRTLVPPPPLDAPRAVGGALAGDPYLLPSLMASTILADLRFSVTNLGPDTPADVLAAAALERKAHLVWLSVSVPAEEGLVRREADALAERLAPSGAEIVLGGRGLNGAASIRHPNLQVQEGMGGLARVARSVAEASTNGRGG